MRLRLKFSVCIIIFMLGRVVAFAQDIHFSTVDPPKDNPWANILGITQDPQGYLWICTGFGLYKYDGHQYKVYHQEPFNTNSLGFNQLECITAGKDGTIWLGTYGRGLDRLDPVTNTFTHYRHHPGDGAGIGNDTVTAVIEDHKGIIWLGTRHGMDRLDPKTGRFSHYANDPKDGRSLSNNGVRVLYEDREGTIWAGTGTPFDGTNKYVGGLNRLDQQTNKFTRYLHDDHDPQSLIDSRVRAIFEDSRGTFWVGTAGDGLHTMDRKTGKFERHLYDPAHPEKLSRPALKKTLRYADDHIVFINEDNSGRIWIGTFQNGINVYDPKTQKITWYGHNTAGKNDTRQNELWANYKTREGVMWISPWLSQDFYKAGSYQNKLPHQRIMGSYVYTFLEDNNNTLWLGTYKGLVHLKSDHTQEAFSLAKGLPDPKNLIWYMTKDNENKLWLAARFNGLYRFDPVSRTFKAYHHKAGDAGSLASDSVFYVKNGTDGKLWVGTLQGLDLLDTRTGKFSHFRNNNKDTTSISDNAIFCIERDKDNILWVGTINRGLNKLDEKTGRFKRYLSSAGLGVYDLLNDSRGNLWACTNTGLYRYDRDKDRFSTLTSLGSTNIGAITEDHQENLWVNTPVDFIKLNVKSNDINVYGPSQGVNGALTTNWGYTRHNGDVLFGDSSGFFIIEPDKLAHRNPDPKTVINKFFLADAPVFPLPGGVLHQPVDRTKEIDLNHTQNTFSFGFTNIDFVGEAGDIVNSYMLKNYESNWRSANSDGSANYYDVPPGNYIFKVKSINSDGGTTIKQIAVIISPPWWKTWWAYTLFVLAFAGSIWGFIYYRSRALLKEKRILEETVQVRTAEVMQQKEEILQQKEEIEAQADQALKQASVDRVRAEIASMRSTDDLERITPLIWTELNVLDVPFIRCGVFIVDEQQRVIHTHLSTPDGKALAAFDLQFDSEGIVQTVLPAWRSKQIATSHWTVEEFAANTKNLVAQGTVLPQERFVTEHPDTSLDLHFFPFLQGMLYVGNTAPLASDEINVVQLLADAFSAAYARYEDFNKLDAAKQEVDKALTELKSAQTQLIQTEKMASLGELTAGIAHEIQNPLNFVNNFSEVNAELIDELKEEIDKGNLDEAKAIADDIKQNQQKINLHGKRADGIVKNMLQHSRDNSGEMQLTDINALADEYLRLSYHGLRAKDKDFSSAMVTNLDSKLPKVNVIPQDFGRVLLNLYNNAFYAVHQKQKTAGPDYKPTVEVTTALYSPPPAGGGRGIEIKVRDNGNGVQDNIKDKIMQPFFTTKPTGEGTGLGLSLTYDIVVKGHGGSINIVTKEGEYTEFIVIIPT